MDHGWFTAGQWTRISKRRYSAVFKGGAALLIGATVLLSVSPPSVRRSVEQQRATLLSRAGSGAKSNKEQRYAALHPVSTSRTVMSRLDVLQQASRDTRSDLMLALQQFERCSREVDMAAFSEVISQKCGDMHAVSTCSAPCAVAMRQHSETFGYHQRPAGSLH